VTTDEVKAAGRFGWRHNSPIRLRLAAAVTVALLPVLLIGGIQAVVAMRTEVATRQDVLIVSAQRAAATARARVEAAQVLLQTLGPSAVGLECAQRLSDVIQRVPGYANLIRFDRAGRVMCAAATVPADAQRAERPWFKRLAAGDEATASADPGVRYTGEPALLAAVRATRADGSFDGAFATVIPLSSLQPRAPDLLSPAGSKIAMLDEQGLYIGGADPEAFTPPPPAALKRIDEGQSARWTMRTPGNPMRYIAAAPLAGESLNVVMSATQESLLRWAGVNPLSRLGLPLLAFVLALGAVLYAADRSVVRWIEYLQRVAELYARGRFTVRPLAAENAPPEIRDLAATLDEMAAAIVARDRSLHESLAQKDDLMREIHHRVKNNLQVISSLLSLQQRGLKDGVAREAVMDTRQRITALAQVYRALYQGPELKRVDLRPFLEELTAQLMSADALKVRSIRTEVHADPLMIDPDRLAPLALFAVEALSVAQKREVQDRGSALTVELHVRGDEAELSIHDHGGARMEAPSGIGHTLMTAFARQLGGALTFETPETGGLITRLVFPTPKVEAEAPPYGTELHR
jgi:two-component sensor histidine kinase